MTQRGSDRLALLSPALVDRIRSASPTAARQAAVAAAEFATSRTRMQDDAVLAALKALKTYPPSQGDRELAEAALARMDDAYFSSQERGEAEEHWDGLFRLARAANAVVSALDSDAHDAACDAAYEAKAATDDLAGVEAAVSRVLHQEG